MGEKRRFLTREDTEATKKHSILDGCFYFVMDGFGTQYIIPYALKLGATNTQVGILSSVPLFIGSLFQLLSAKITEQVKSRKKFIAIFAFLQAFMFIPMFLVPLVTKDMLALTIIFSFYVILDNMISPAWHSLIGDAIAEKDREDYFGKRNKITLLSLVVSMLVAGIILNYYEAHNIWLGFWILFTIALFGRVASVISIMHYHEPENKPPVKEKIKFSDFIRTINSNNFGNYAIFRSAFMFSVMVASPFFTVYMLKSLGFSYVQFTTVILISLVARGISSPYWARYSKQYGTRNMMYVSSLLVALVPLVWFLVGFFFEKNPAVYWMIMLAEIVTGFAWGGFELTAFNYMLQNNDHDNRSRLFAYFNVFFGFFNLLGGLIGTVLVTHLADNALGISAKLVVFLISFFLRFTSVITMMPRVKELKVKSGISDRRLFVQVGIIKPGIAVIHAAMTTYQNIEAKSEQRVNRQQNSLMEEIRLEELKIKKIFTQARKKRRRHPKGRKRSHKRTKKLRRPKRKR